VQAYLYGKEATVDGLVFPRDVPAKRFVELNPTSSGWGGDNTASGFEHAAAETPSRNQKRGCLGLILMAMIPIVVGIVVAILPI
jgi:hypothetical protein